MSRDSRRRRIVRLFLSDRAAQHGHLDALDGLRGIAVLLVLVSHMAIEGLHPLPGVPLFGVGKYGVYLFFVLSAFLLTLPMVAGPPSRLLEARRWLHYGTRRVLRIFPLYFVVLTVSLLAWRDGASPPFVWMPWEHYAQHLLLQRGTEIFWTIPVETTYYLVLPLVALTLVFGLGRSVWLGGLAGASAIAASLQLWPPDETPLNSLGLGVYLPIFLCGSLAALAHSTLSVRGGLRSGSARTFAEMAAVAAGLCVLLMVPAIWNSVSGRGVDQLHFHRRYLWFGLLWSVVVLGVLNGRGWLDRALSWRPLRFVGVISFSLYLWHLALVRALSRHVDLAPLPLAWLAVAATILVSAVSFLLIERPLVRSAWIGRRLRAISHGRR